MLELLQHLQNQLKNVSAKLNIYPGDRYFKRHLPLEFFDLLYKITSSCPSELSLRARLDLISRGLTQPPKCVGCENFVRLAKTVGFRWLQTCGSRACVQKLNIQNCQEKFGTSYPNQNAEIVAKSNQTRAQRIALDPAYFSKRTAKAAQTCLKRYGCENASQNAAIREKVKRTFLLKYGAHPWTLTEIREKQHKTNLQRYGHAVATKNEQIRRIISSKAQTRAVSSISPESLEKLNSISFWTKNYFEQRKTFFQISQELGCGLRIVKAYFSKLGLKSLRHHPPESLYSSDIQAQLRSSDFWHTTYVVEKQTFDQIASKLRISPSRAGAYFHRYSRCKSRYRIATSQAERALRQLIQQAKVSYQFSLKMKNLGSQILERQSLDIYIPELKLAFEYNGVYWHSEKYRDSSYHLKKTLECERLGIRLIHIWEDDWVFKRSLMERKIKVLLGKEEQRVFARKCSIVVPTIEQKRNFYQANHIKGDGTGSVSYALQYQDQLVAMITFRVASEGWDLNRYATSCSVPGGFSRLLEHFKRNHSWFKIYTFADRSWSRGDVYLKCGFQLVAETPPAFYGVEAIQRKNRLNYTHERLAKRFPKLQGTQFQIMDQAGIPRIWDCGQLKFELNKKGAK